MKIVVVIALLIVGYFILRSVGGESVTAPEVDTDLPVPDSPEDGVNSAADWLDTRPAWFWQFAACGIVLAVIWTASRKLPKLFWILVGMVVMGFIAFAVMQ